MCLSSGHCRLSVDGEIKIGMLSCNGTAWMMPDTFVVEMLGGTVGYTANAHVVYCSEVRL